MQGAFCQVRRVASRLLQLFCSSLSVVACGVHVDKHVPAAQQHDGVHCEQRALTKATNCQSFGTWHLHFFEGGPTQRVLPHAGSPGAAD